MEIGAFGKIGRAGLNALKERQHSAKRITRLDEDILESLHLVKTIIQLRPERVIYTAPPLIKRFVGASDAAWESQVGTGGFLIVLLDKDVQERIARVAVVDDAWYEAWENHTNYIAQLELVMILVAILSCAEKLRGRRGVWFIDNVAALMALVKGRSRNSDLDKMAGAIHAAMFSLRTWI